MKNAEIAIGDVKIGRRYRVDLGDLASLSASIERLGLLHPIVVSKNNDLVCGIRRLKSCERLGWKKIPARVVDLGDLLRAEHDENVERKSFTPSEAVSIGRAIEELEKPKAAERQAATRAKKGEGDRLRTGASPKNGSGKLPEPCGDTRDRVAEAVGMSGKTYEKAKAIVEAAEQKPKVFGDLVEQMDKTGKVDGAFKEMKKRAGTGPKKTPPKKYDVEDDVRQFIKLRDKLSPNWVHEADKAAIRQTFQQMANEV